MSYKVYPTPDSKRLFKKLFNKYPSLKADYTNLNHQQAIVALANEYIKDEMGGGETLTGQSAKNLISGLQSTSSAFSLLAIVNNDFAGLTNCFINFTTFRA